MNVLNFGAVLLAAPIFLSELGIVGTRHYWLIGLCIAVLIAVLLLMLEDFGGYSVNRGYWGASFTLLAASMIAIFYGGFITLVLLPFCGSRRAGELFPEMCNWTYVAFILLVGVISMTVLNAPRDPNDPDGN